MSVSQTEQRLLTVDVDRRGYGRRYTSLPVDELRGDGFSIQFAGSYIRPEHLDLRQGDIVRWRDSGTLMQGVIAGIRRAELVLHIDVGDVAPLPPEAFYP